MKRWFKKLYTKINTKICLRNIPHGKKCVSPPAEDPPEGAEAPAPAQRRWPPPHLPALPGSAAHKDRPEVPSTDACAEESAPRPG